MDKLQLPQVPATLGNNIVITNVAWKALVDYLNATNEIIQAQSQAIEYLIKDVERLTSDTATLAAVLGGIYNAQE